jgi:hypothetical protein
VREEGSARKFGAAALAFAVGAGLLALGARRAPRRRPNAEASGLYLAAGLLALSVLADSALEHYRGEFKNPGMYAPLVLSTAVLALSVQGAAGRGGAGPVYGAAVAAGAVGAGFHWFNILKRPGGFSWLNLFYAAPIGAPAALSLSGMMGLAADAVADDRRSILGVSTGRAAAALCAAGMLGTVGEAGMLHYRGAFQNPFMWLPVAIPPVGAALLARAGVERRPGWRPLTKGWLALTAALGLGGVGFHIFGVHRAMGGWRNWRQNLVDGPPIPAPPAFTAFAIGGFASLRLREREAA